MTGPDPSPNPPVHDADAAKAALVFYLDRARDALLWKFTGLGERDLRRPLTPTGTNLLGSLKHLAFVEAGYFGEGFGRPFPEQLPGMEPDDPPNVDMYAGAEESLADILALWGRVRAHADATIAAVPLDARGEVAWWPAERRHPTLQTVLVHVLTDWNRHLGQIDILREQLDGSVGYLEGAGNLPGEDEIDWPAYVAELQRIADQHA